VDEERIYYRIVRNADATEDDFKPAKDLGKPLRRPSLARQWAEGVSVSDTFEHAAAQARLYRYRLGRFVVAIRLPRQAGIEVEQTGRDLHHFTLYGTPAQLLSLVADRPRRVDEE
jgi:hypothetical protein